MKIQALNKFKPHQEYYKEAMSPNLFNLFLDYTVCVHAHVKRWPHYLSIPYYIPNESTNRKWHSCFPSWGQYTDDDIGWWHWYSYHRSLIKKNQHSLPSVPRSRTKLFQNRKYELKLEWKQWQHIPWIHHKNYGIYLEYIIKIQDVELIYSKHLVPWCIDQL